MPADGEPTVSRPAWGRETALVLVLFAAYRLGRLLTAGNTRSALANAERVLRWQQLLRLPAEQAVQDWALHAPALVRAANVYYAGVHFPATVLFLIVLYWRRQATTGRCAACSPS